MGRRHLQKARGPCVCHAVGEVSLFTADGGFDLVASRFDRRRSAEISFSLKRSRWDSRVLAGGWLPRRPRCTTCFHHQRLHCAVLYECFGSMYVCKPCTRQASKSERYLVCISRLVCTARQVSEHVRRGAHPSTATPAVREAWKVAWMPSATLWRAPRPHQLSLRHCHRLPSRTCMRSVGATPTAKMSPSHPGTILGGGCTTCSDQSVQVRGSPGYV
jgi:hypothetical protein